MNSGEIPNGDLEARIIRLEESLWFQERKLEDLDQLVTELHAQQNALARQMEEMGKLIRQMRDVLDAQSRHGQAAEPAPPHYQQL